MSRVAAAAVALAVTLGACSADGPAWSDARELGGPAVADALAVAEDGTVRIAEGTDGGVPCAQVTVGELTMQCLRTAFVAGAAGGWSSAALRADDTRFVDVRVGPGADSFVLWSNRSPEGRRVAATQAAGSSVLVWVMDDGEAPWGVQAIGPDGTLWHALPFVGLPDG